MKRFLMPIVAAVLMISSVIFTPTAVVPVVSVGAGDGENTMILEVEELAPVIDFITSKKYSSASKDDEPTIDDGSDIVKSENHTSAMLIEETQMYMNNEVSGKYKQVISLNRSLTMAFTEDASYYVSKVSCKYIYRDYDDSKNSAEYYIVTDMCVYIDDDQTLINIKKFDVTGDYGEEIGDLTEYLGQWIKVPNQIAINLLEMVDEMNQTFFDNIKGYIDEVSEGKDKLVYEFKDSLMSEDDTQVTIDISDPETPYVNIMLEYSEEGNSMYMNDTISFCNIDNAVIKVNTGNVKEVDEEEFEKIFMGE